MDFKFKNTVRNFLIADIMKAVTVAVVANIIKSQLSGKKILGQEFLRRTMITLIGLIVYHLITRNVIVHDIRK